MNLVLQTTQYLKLLQSLYEIRLIRKEKEYKIAKRELNSVEKELKKRKI